jgi:hypothetical protein
VHRYDAKHRTLSIGLNQPTKVLQKGVRERLLCDQCEGRLQKYEDYFARLWFTDQVVPLITSAPGYLPMAGVDYAKFKLFALSVVWRAGASRLPEFAGMTLGPHQERIRQMILDGEPGTAHEYPIICELIVDTDSGALQDEVLMAPMTIRVAGHNAARMMFAGVSWTILTSSHRAPDLDPLCLQEDGSIVMHVADWRSHADMSGIADVARAVNAPDLR